MKIALIILLFLLGIGAIYGGSFLIISPSGELLGLPISMLEPSPFDSFLIPGIILFIILGLAPCLVIYGLVTKKNNNYAESLNIFSDMHWSWSYSIYISIALIIWIQLQMVFINDVHWSYTLYMFWAIFMIVLAIHPKVRNQYRKLV